MAHLRRLGFFAGTNYEPANKIWTARIPITQQQAEGTSANPYEINGLPTLLALSRMMAMPFAEFMDFQWRVKKWKFSSPNELLERNEYTFEAAKTELDLNGYSAFNFGSGLSVHGLINTYKIACPLESPVDQVCSRVCWLIWSTYTCIAFGPAELQNRDDQYINLSYAPLLSSQSFAGPTEIIKTGYLTFDVVFNTPFSSAAEPVTVSISPDEWWTYGGRYSAATGQEL